MENQAGEEIHRVKAAAFKNTVESLFLSIEKKAEEDPETAENAILEEILALSDLLGEVVERALDLIDNTPIKLIRSTHSPRELFEIQGDSRVYRLFPKLPFCCCRSFHNQVVQGEEYCCKHFIAARIARALGKVEIEEKSLLDFRKTIKQIQF